MHFIHFQNSLTSTPSTTLDTHRLTKRLLRVCLSDGNRVYCSTVSRNLSVDVPSHSQSLSFIVCPWLDRFPALQLQVSVHSWDSSCCCATLTSSAKFGFVFSLNSFLPLSHLSLGLTKFARPRWGFYLCSCSCCSKLRGVSLQKSWQLAGLLANTLALRKEDRLSLVTVI